jgi:hypothetical protein
MLPYRMALAAMLLSNACGGASATPAGASAPSSPDAPALSADTTDPLANPPTYQSVAAADGDAGAPEAKLSTADLQAGLDLARAKLKSLPRYQNWQKGHERYDTTVSVLHGHVFVLFNPPLSTDQEITIEVDVASKQVVHVEQGEA